MNPGRPWLEGYEPGVPADLLPAATPFHAILEGASASAPELPALSYFGRSIAYAELDALSHRVASALAACGVGPGATVATVQPAGPAFVATAFGALRAGAAVMPLPYTTSAAQAVPAIGRHKPRVIVAGTGWWRGSPDAGAFGPALRVAVPSDEGLPGLLRLAARLSGRATRWHGEAMAWSEWLRTAQHGSPSSQFHPDDPALVVASDASDITFAHRHLVAGAAMLRAWLTDSAPGADTWIIAISPMTALGFAAALGTGFELQARLVFVDPSDRAALNDALGLGPGYVLAGPGVTPPEWWRQERDRARHPRAWLTYRRPGEPARAEDDQSVCTGLSLQCAAGLVTCQPLNGVRRWGSLGLPLPGVDVGVIDGELGFRAPNVVGPSEWCGLGAPGRLDADGNVWLELQGPDERVPLPAGRSTTRVRP